MMTQKYLKNIETLMAASLSQWVESEDPTSEEFFEIVQPWMEKSSGETWVCPEWWNRVRPEQGIFVWGGDFLREDRDLANKVWCKLEEIGFECTDSGQCSTCDTCGLLVGTNYDDSYLVTDGAIYCPDCAGDLLRGAVEACSDKTPCNIHTMCSDWSIAMTRTQILEAFPTHWGWHSQNFGYPDRESDVFARFSELKAKGFPCCIIPGYYNWEWTLVWMEDESNG